MKYVIIKKLHTNHGKHIMETNNHHKLHESTYEELDTTSLMIKTMI